MRPFWVHKMPEDMTQAVGCFLFQDLKAHMNEQLNVEPGFEGVIDEGICTFQGSDVELP